MYATLLFDVEDIISPEADDVARTVADIVSSEGAVATFCVVGARARQWRERGRRDVIDALGRHDIGFHTTLHSVHPTVLEYLVDAGWEDGIDAVVRRERTGIDEIRTTLGRSPSCFGGPGNTWAPQVNAAMRGLGIPAVVYAQTRVPRGDVHRYCGALCYPTGISVGDDRYHERDEWEKSLQRVLQELDRRRQAGAQWTEVFCGHPSRILHHGFWDAPNFADGRQPPPGQWLAPRRKSDAELAVALRSLRETIRAVLGAPGVAVRTIGQMNVLFERAAEEELTAAELAEAAEATDANIAGMAGWPILPRGLDLGKVRAIAREKLPTLRRLTLS